MHRSQLDLQPVPFGRRVLSRLCRYVSFALLMVPSAQRAVAAEATVPCETCAPIVRAGDEVWLISTRDMPCPDGSADAAKSLPTWRYDGKGGFQPSSLSTFVSAVDVNTTTCFWLHGNQTEEDDARNIGLTVYRELVSGQPAEHHLRLVIWSWPSEQVARALQDVRIKAPRSDVTGYYLAAVIDRLDRKAPLALIGYSFGARGVATALQLTAGGNVAGYVLPGRDPAPRLPIHVVLMAAAFDDDWLLPGRREGLALSQMDRLLLVNNSCDRVLKHYNLLYGIRCCNEALGYVGLSVGSLSEADSRKVIQMDACCIVGSEHEWSNYILSPSVMAPTRSVVFGEPIGK